MIKKFLILIISLLLFLVGCSKDSTKENVIDTEKNNITVNNNNTVNNTSKEDNEKTETKDNKTETTKQDTTKTTKQNDIVVPAPTRKEGSELACVIASSLRVRNAPNGDFVYEENSNEVMYAAPKCYKVLDKQEANSYTWIKVDEGKWFAYDKEWVLFRNENAYDNLYEAGARTKTKDFESYHYSSYIDYPMDNTAKELSAFLFRAIPGMPRFLGGYFQYINFDFSNINDTVKEAILKNAMKNTMSAKGTDGCEEQAKTIYFNITRGKDLGFGYFSLGIGGLNFCTKEDIDYFVETHYDGYIDLTTIAYYDAKPQLFAETLPSGLGEPMPQVIVVDYEINDDIVTATAALLECGQAGNIYDSEAIRNHDWKEVDNNNDYIKNNAHHCTCKIRVMEDGSYRLISVHH